MAEAGPREVYLYAIVVGRAEESLGQPGLFGSDVRFVPVGRVAAVVSDVPEGTGKIRPERRNLAAHQVVISKLLAGNHPILPVAFGTVSPSAESLVALLRRHEADLLAQVERIGRAVEMELRVELKVDNAFEYFVNSKAELREARDRVFGNQSGPSRDDKIALGQHFERVLEGERQEVASGLERAFDGAVLEVKRNECRNEKQIARLSCLVPGDRQTDFEKALERGAGELGDQYTIVLTGPLPAYSFVELHLQAEG